MFVCLCGELASFGSEIENACPHSNTVGGGHAPCSLVVMRKEDKKKKKSLVKRISCGASIGFGGGRRRFLEFTHLVSGVGKSGQDEFVPQVKTLVFKPLKCCVS